MRFLLLFLCIASCCFGFDGWTHLELGAGNYGKFGGRSRKQEEFDPAVQYAVLFWTLDELVARHGEEGIFFVNDIKNEYSSYATKKLQEYALEKGLSHVSILSAPGDYTQMPLIPLLEPFGREIFDSIHIKNPEGNFYGRHQRNNTQEESRRKTREMLKKLANMGKEGLYLFILDTPVFLPDKEKEEFINRGIFEPRGKRAFVHYVVCVFIPSTTIGVGRYHIQVEFVFDSPAANAKNHSGVCSPHNMNMIILLWKINVFNSLVYVCDGTKKFSLPVEPEDACGQGIYSVGSNCKSSRECVIAGCGDRYITVYFFNGCY